jgi:hypothetical protein
MPPTVIIDPFPFSTIMAHLSQWSWIPTLELSSSPPCSTLSSLAMAAFNGTYHLSKPLHQAGRPHRCGAATIDPIQPGQEDIV